MPKSVILSTEEVFRTAYSNKTDEITFTTPEHGVIYVARGYIDVLIDGHLVASLKENDGVFVHRDRRISLVRYPSAETGIQFSVLLRLPRHILFEFYKNFDAEDLPQKRYVRMNRKPVFKIEKCAMLSSIFDAFRPYWQAGDEPGKEWLRMKILEAVRLLSTTDKETYSQIFDFASNWRRDIMEFMERNYMYELSIDEIANYTGRSTSTFKRDFAKLTELTPRNWLIERRLKAAYELITTTDLPINRIMADVGFKNFSHFTRAYRQRFGCTPTQSRKS